LGRLERFVSQVGEFGKYESSMAENRAVLGKGALLRDPLQPQRVSCSLLSPPPWRASDSLHVC
jgi:hypothetical protein